MTADAHARMVRRMDQGSSDIPFQRRTGSSRLRYVLARPFLPPDARLRLRQQHRDELADEDVRAVLSEQGVSVRSAAAAAGGWTSGSTRWPALGSVDWDGSRLRMVGASGRSAEWYPVSGGLRPGFDAVEVSAARFRPPTSGECPGRVAAVAAVGLAGHRVCRVYFLDAESRSLSWIPVAAFAEDHHTRLAKMAGVEYHQYELTLAGYSSARVSPAGLCEALFPSSVRQVKLTSEYELSESVEQWYRA